MPSPPWFNNNYSEASARPGRLHLNNKSEPKKPNKRPILQLVYVDSGLNMHSEDLLSCIDVPLKSNIHNPKGLSRFFPPFPCQHTDLQSGSSITEQQTVTQRGEKLNTRWKKNGFCWRGMENKTLLLYLVKVTERRECKFTPDDDRFVLYRWTGEQNVITAACTHSKPLDFTTLK